MTTRKWSIKIKNEIHPAELLDWKDKVDSIRDDIYNCFMDGYVKGKISIIMEKQKKKKSKKEVATPNSSQH